MRPQWSDDSSIGQQQMVLRGAFGPTTRSGGTDCPDGGLQKASELGKTSCPLLPPSANSLTMTPYTKLPILLVALTAIVLFASEGRADYVLGECCLLRLPYGRPADASPRLPTAECFSGP